VATRDSRRLSTASTPRGSRGWVCPFRPPGEHEDNYEAHFGPLWYAFRHKSSWFIVLYSDEGNPETGEKSFTEPASQRMSDEQLEFVEESLRRARGADHVFVFLHHPRWLGGGYGDDWDRVHQRLVQAGNVTAVFAGHIHCMRYDGVRDGIEYFTLATVGGAQSGTAPRAGYLHQYHLVTVRKQGIAVVAVPVGAALDPRQVTGELSDLVRVLADTPLELIRIPELVEGARVVGELVVRVQNPTRCPVEARITCPPPDALWVVSPDHAHTVLRPGSEALVTFRMSREWMSKASSLSTEQAGILLSTLRLPELEVELEVLGDELRVAMPGRTIEVPVVPRWLPDTEGDGLERVLVLDGVDDHLRVEHSSIPLADGPLTLEGWLRADEFRSRQGFVTKAESSEYGLFVSGGAPEFCIHLGGRYVIAKTEGPILDAGRWHHLAGVYDGSQVRLYVDGRLVAEASGSGKRTVRDVPLLIGADTTGTGEPMSFTRGRIDGIRLSACARYEGREFLPQRSLVVDEDTALLFSMESVGPWIRDVSGRSAHGSRRGGIAVEVEEGRGGGCSLFLRSCGLRDSNGTAPDS